MFLKQKLSKRKQIRSNVSILSAKRTVDTSKICPRYISSPGQPVWYVMPTKVTVNKYPVTKVTYDTHPVTKVTVDMYPVTKVS